MTTTVTDCLRCPLLQHQDYIVCGLGYPVVHTGSSGAIPNTFSRECGFIELRAKGSTLKRKDLDIWIDDDILRKYG